MRARTKQKETKEVKKKKTKKSNNQDHDNQVELAEQILELEKESKLNFFYLFDDELKKLDDISLGYIDIYQRLLIKLEEFKNENNDQFQSKNNQILCSSPSGNQNAENNFNNYQK